MKIVKVPNWLTKTPGLNRVFKPLMAGGGSSRLSNQDNAIIMKIVQEVKNQNAQDIETMVQAKQALEDPANPRWYMYQDLLDYLEPDSQLGTAKDLRASATLSRKFIIYDKKTELEQPEKTQLLLHKEWFFNFVWHYLDAVLYGYTVSQLVDPVTMKFDYIPRRNFIPQRDMIMFEVGGDKGIKVDDPAFKGTIISTKFKHAKGILSDIIPNLIWKKNSRHAWAEFSEKFGIPMISATTNKRDKVTLDRIEAMLKSLGEAATAVLPEGTLVNIHDQALKGDPYNVFLKQIEVDDAAIAKRLLGGTMLTDNGSSRSQGEVHERNLHELLGLFDKMVITFVVNDKLLPLMAANGYPFTENDGFKFDEAEKIPLKELWSIVKEAVNIYDIEPSFVAKTFNLPIKGLKQSNPGKENGNFNSPTSAMAAALVGFDVMLPNYKPTCGHRHHSRFTAGFSSNILEHLSDVLINEIWVGKDTLTTEVLKSIAGHRQLLDGLFDGWGDRRLEMTYDATDLHCLASMEYNLFEFSRMKERSNVIALNHLKLDLENNNVRDFTDFREKSLQYLKNPDMHWLKTEYNHTIAVGQGSSRYHQFMSEVDEVTEWGIIQTIGDDQVRASHQVLEGKKVNLKENGGPDIWTPFDIGCRCEILQHLGEVDPDDVVNTDSIYELIDKSPGDKWTGNRGKTEQVFTSAEQYMKTTGLAKEINALNYRTYGLKDFDDLKENYKTLELDETITTKNVKELFSKEKGTDFMGFEDHLGRKMILKEDTFKDHVKKKRHQLFEKISDVLKDPDEVYYSRHGKGEKGGVFQTRYIKFYNDQAVVVTTDLGSDQVEINSWGTMDDELKDRKGYLIHKKAGNDPSPE
jgi:hypothetical protein